MSMTIDGVTLTDAQVAEIVRRAEEKKREVVFAEHHGMYIKTTAPEAVCVAVRGSGEYLRKGIYLDPCFNWRLEVDDEDITVAIPTRKEAR